MKEYISPQEKLPNEGEIVYLIFYANSQTEEVKEDSFVSVYYGESFLTGKRNPIPMKMVYKWCPTSTYYNPFKEARLQIQTIINKDEDDNNAII